MASINSLIDQIEKIISQDKHDGARFRFVSELKNRSIIPEIPDGWFDQNPTTPLPKDWKAIEYTVFDNGDIPKPKRKRSKVRTSKTRFGGTIKAWRSSKIDFHKDAPWKYTISFYEKETANTVAEQLNGENYINDHTVSTVAQMVKHMENSNVDFRVGLAKRKGPKYGTRWLKDHVFLITLEDGLPNQYVLSAPDLNIENSFVGEDASDRPLRGKAVAQSRLGNDPIFDGWRSR